MFTLFRQDARRMTANEARWCVAKWMPHASIDVMTRRDGSWYYAGAGHRFAMELTAKVDSLELTYQGNAWTAEVAP